MAVIATTYCGAAIALAVLSRWLVASLAPFEPIVGWMLVGCFWLVAVLEFSPWPLARGAARPVAAAFAIVILAALFLVFSVQRAIGADAAWIALCTAVLANFVRLLLELNGIALWKPDRDNQA